MRQKQDVFLSVFAVALLAEGVDRNGRARPTRPLGLRVALLAEGVDRNYAKLYLMLLLFVALLAEGVDRNAEKSALSVTIGGSPSSRRAWIEIGASGSHARS